MSILMPFTGSLTAAGHQPSVRPLVVEGQFGWLHLSDHVPRRTAGFVFIAPPGRDGRCVHRHIRSLAQSLAGMGFPVLRIEPLGVGDSLDLARDDAAWLIWRRGAEQARDLLKSLTGVDQVIMSGLRMGGRLAADIAADGWLLLAPVASGKTWLRELKLSAAMSGTSGPEGEEGLESEGLHLSAAAVRSLQSVDLAGLKATGGAALVFAQNAQAASVGARLEALGVSAETEAFPGYEDLLDDSHSSKAPLAVFEKALIWADQTFPGIQPASAAPELPACRLSGPDFEEVALDLGEGLTGLITRPASPSGLGLVICNTSCDPRAGIGRFGASTARSLAAQGVTSLRFDFLSMGDSDAEGAGHMYLADRNPEFARVEAYLRGQGCSKIALLGVCSGAFHALRAISAIPTLDQAYCVSSRLVWQDGDSLDPQFRDQGKATVSYVAGVRNPETWKRLLRGDIDLLAVGRTLWGRLLTKVKARLNSKASAPLRQGIAAVSARGGSVRLVMGLEDASLDELESYFGPKAVRFTRQPGMSMRVIEDLDHGLAKAASRDKALADLKAFLGIS